MKRINTLDLTGSIVIFDYVNWRGKAATRLVRVIHFFYGKTEYHEEPQFFLHGMDINTGEKRDFAVKDITHLRQQEGWTS